MKKIVWINKSNGQLCVTMPKNSGISEGDIVSVEKQKIKRVVYSSTTADLFHYGQLRILQKANELGDFHICGVLTDEAIKTYKNGPIAGFKERQAIVSGLRCVDMVMTQNNFDPTSELKKIKEQFENAKIILVCGSNWKKVPGADYIKKINGEVIHLPFYDKLSTKNILNKIHQMEGGKFMTNSDKNSKKHSKKKEVVIYTAGTWDLFHVGHLNLFEKSKKLGTKLIVGVSTDELVKSYKKSYPTIPYEYRAMIVNNCKYVDQIVKQENILDIEQMKKLKIDILTIGDDWKNKHLDGLEWAKKQPNLKLIYLPYTKDISSTKIKEGIKNG